MVGVNIASLSGTCRVTTRGLLVYGGDQAVAVERIISGGCELRARAGR